MAARSCHLASAKTTRNEDYVQLRKQVRDMEVEVNPQPLKRQEIKASGSGSSNTHPHEPSQFSTGPLVELDRVEAPQPVEGTESVPLMEGTDRMVQIGSDLGTHERCNLINLLRAHEDVFAYSADEMLGIDPGIISHHLTIDPTKKPVKQKKRHFSYEKNQAIEAEVNKLLDARFIELCHYPDWLANVVMVKKPNSSWRMCVDFTDLNKACPKDCYPLPRIDQLVDSTSGHARLTFTDAFSGYHQIHMHPLDKKKTAFITSCGVYNYVMMPFGLKNADATYQRMMDQVFEAQRGRNLEVYVDDAIVKSVHLEDHVEDLAKNFANLRKFQVKLNPKKCVFGVRSGKFLGFMVSQRGIDANPDKVKAALDLPEPRSIKDIQRVTGRMAALSRFIARSSEKSQPFFKVLKGNK